MSGTPWSALSCRRATHLRYAPTSYVCQTPARCFMRCCLQCAAKEKWAAAIKDAVLEIEAIRASAGKKINRKNSTDGGACVVTVIVV